VRQGQYKLVKQGPDLELFDLSADVGEQKTIAVDKPDVVQKLQDLHDRWNSELIEPLWQNPKPAAKKVKTKQ